MIEQLSGQIAVLVLFYNKLKQTAECIQSFLPSGENIYVLNNGSAVADFAALQKRFQGNNELHFLDAGKNLGPSGGRNYLIEHTTEPWLIFVDNDITIKPTENWKQLLERFLDENQEAEIVCPLIFNVHEHEFMERLNLQINNGVLDLLPVTNKVTNFFPEGGAIVKRNVFARYGMYDEEMYAFEGYEFSLRCMQSQFGELKVFCTDSIELIHDHRFQQKKTDKEAVHSRYNVEKMQNSYNRLIQKHNVVFQHDWQWWTVKQVEDMTSRNLWKKVKRKLKGLIRE